MTITYKTTGVCASRIDFDLIDGKVYNVKFFGGCDGNAKGISSLVEGLDATEVVSRLQGIKCGYKKTSCPDQLTKAIEANL